MKYIPLYSNLPFSVPQFLHLGYLLLQLGQYCYYTVWDFTVVKQLGQYPLFGTLVIADGLCLYLNKSKHIDPQGSALLRRFSSSILVICCIFPDHWPRASLLSLQINSNFFNFKFLQFQISSTSKIFIFKRLQPQTSSTSIIFNFKLQLQTSTLNFPFKFKRQYQT